MLKTGGEIIVDYLIKAGVEYFIGIPGHGCLALFDALRDRAEKGEIKYIQVKQEMSAVHMADGYYRATHKPLAVFTSIGAGALNTAIGLATSFVDSTAVLTVIGDAHVNMKGSGVLQEIEKKQDSDIINCFRPITKRCWRVESIVQLPKIIRRAFAYMLSGRKGPVLISVPMDVQAESIDIENDDISMSAKFECGVPAHPECVKTAFEMMRKAKRPVIVAGGGVLLAEACGELKALAEKWGAAVITTMAGKSCFPEDHPLYGWHGGSKGTEVGNYLCRNADVILALGCRFADETTSSYRKGATYNFPDTKLIQIDIDPTEIGKNYPCDVGINADIKCALKQFIDIFNENKFEAEYQKTEYFKEIQQEKAKWLEKIKGTREASENFTISEALAIVNQTYPRDGIIVTSSGNAQAQILQEYMFTKPETFITSGGFSTMGFAYPAALGVKLAKKDVPVLAIAGDGDFMMTMQEMATAVQYDIPVIAMIMNNYGWMAIKDLQIDVYGSRHAYGNDFTTPDGKQYSPDFALAAKSFGIASFCAKTAAEVEKALIQAIALKKPALIEVIVDNTYPYSGGKAYGWWDVPVPGYIKDAHDKYLDGRKDEQMY